MADNLFNGVQRCTATPTVRTQRPIRPLADYSHIVLSPLRCLEARPEAADGVGSMAKLGGIAMDAADTAATIAAGSFGCRNEVCCSAAHCCPCVRAATCAAVTAV